MQSDKKLRRRPELMLGLLWVILTATMAFAHPMGNFSVNHYSKISVGQQSIEILYLVDMAEIPTYQELREFDITPKADDPSVDRYSGRQEPVLRAGLAVEIDGQPVHLETVSRRLAFADGAGGLQ
jgi:nickel/cobalt exporter